jgi:molybdopterin-guanine dinucleotide biosynthesis protein A
MTKRAAIILSGGKAERFQNSHQTWLDKSLVKLHGKPLLIHDIENVIKVVEEVIICVNSEKRKRQYNEILKKHNAKNIRLLIDKQCNGLGGPIVGILTGLTASNADYCFTLPSDMPFFRPEVIEHMFGSTENAHVVVPMWPNGQPETLTMVLKKPEVLEIVKTLCLLRRPRSDDIIRGALNAFLISTDGVIRAFDPELKSFTNINSQADLAKLQPRQAEGTITKSIRINLGDLPIPKLQHLQVAATFFNEGKFTAASEAFSSYATQLQNESCYFWAAISRENEGKSLLNFSKLRRKRRINKDQREKSKKALLEAAKLYELEAKKYDSINGIFLAKRARSNKNWCKSTAN